MADLLDQRGFSEVAKKLDPTRCEPEDSGENEIADEVPPPPKPVPTALRDASAEDILQSYKDLYEWVRQSLDIYKFDLYQILFPVFSHFYVALCKMDFLAEARELLLTYRDTFDAKHAENLNFLAMINSKEQVMKDDELPIDMQYYSKVRIRMSSFAFKILVAFLQDNNLWLVLTAINQRINIDASSSDVYSRQNGGIGRQQRVPSYNTSQVSWGVQKKRKRPIEKHMQQEVDLYEKKLQQNNLKQRDKVKTQNKLHDAKKRNKQYEEEVVWIGHAENNKQVMPNYLSSKSANDDWKSDIVGKLLVRDSMTTVKAEEEDMKKICHLGYTVDRKNKAKGSTKSYSFSGKDDPTLPSIACFTMLNSGDSLTSLDVSSDGAVIAGGYSDHVVRLWRLDGEKNIGKEYGVWNNQNSINYNRSNVAISKGQPEEAYARLVGHTMGVTACSISPDNRWLLTSSQDSKVKLWDVKTELAVSTFSLGTEGLCPMWDVSFAPYGYYFVSGSHDNLGYMWTMEQTVPVRHFHGHKSDVETIKFHPNNLLVASGSSDSSVRLWDCRDAKAVRIFDNFKGSVNSLAFSPNGEFIASAGSDNCIHIWSISKGTKFDTIKWEEPSDSIDRNVWSLDYSIDGTILASGSGDGRLRLWDAALVQKANDSKGRAFRTSFKHLPNKKYKDIEMQVYAAKCVDGIG